MKVHEIMTPHARCVGPENTLVEAAGLMRELDVGALPVCEEHRLVGMVTDRDMVVRGTADGRDPNATLVREVMSVSVISVRADQDVEEAVRVMEGRQIRRLPVIGRNDRIVGIISLGDIATSSNPAFSGMALRDVSEQRNPTARQRRLAERSAPARMPMLRGAAQPAQPGAKRAATGKTKPSRKRSSRTTPRRSPAKRKTSRRAPRSPQA